MKYESIDSLAMLECPPTISLYIYVDLYLIISSFFYLIFEQLSFQLLFFMTFVLLCNRLWGVKYYPNSVEIDSLSPCKFWSIHIDLHGIFPNAHAINVHYTHHAEIHIAYMILVGHKSQYFVKSFYKTSKFQ